ncbi:hypothetical protein POJ06DRAFT_240712 [Lipomyces tetrasporus]|uniref:Uncharacterized protein n=1 Tax=Lipomyces tetrasporus TaxID=54092 RepID=A0AAD7QM25_9ASCO|nr:uncharacterized protein POJ06DRAFT_240712 [Lipomyces tetrasporus]KAJ8097386.1 hypothetical protein POJ06DRAFT_240712 [Lipomyces tetrasporus]
MMSSRASLSEPRSATRSSTTVQATTPASFSASRFLKGNDYGSSLKAANRLGSSPSEFASSLLMNDDIHDPFASEDEADGRVEPAGAGEGKRDRGIEMDDIVHDIEYVPAVIQVMGPETGKSRYVSAAHLLGNVIVFEEFVKELTAMVQVRSTLIDRVDYGWPRHRSRRR